jgi:thioredoxin 1
MVTKNNYEMEVTNEEFKEIINNSHKLVVVDFFAEWCMPCIMMSPVIDDLSVKIKEVKFAKINIDDNRELTDKYNVASIPCLVIFKNGKEVDRIVGGRPVEVVEEKIRMHLK